MNTPDHYKNYPPGFNAPAIDYMRPMYSSQGNAMKYLMRLGLKDDIEADLAKCRDYLDDVLDHGTALDVAHQVPRIDPNITHQSKAAHYLIHGNIRVVIGALDLFGPRILEQR